MNSSLMLGKKKHFSSFLLCFLLLVASTTATLSFIAESGNGATPLNKLESSVSITYHFPEPKIEEVCAFVHACLFNKRSNSYVSVTMDGLPQYGATGLPVLPFKTVKILLPFGTRFGHVRVIGGKKIPLLGSYLVEYGQEPVPFTTVGSADAPAMNSLNETVYGSSEPFPGRLYSDVSVQSKMGYKILLVNLFPVEYIPETGKLFYYESIRLEVEVTSENGGETSAFNGYLQHREVVKGTVDNPEVIETYPTSEQTPTYQYVIITNEELNSTLGPYNFQALRDDKSSRGISATIVMVEWIYANYNGTRPDGGQDNQTRIRNFIIDAYNNWGTMYVLLGGDGDGGDVGGESGDVIIPHRGFASVSGEIDYDIPADMYYGCLDGTFDYDADGIYGEPNDGPGGGEVDLFAEVYVGRACVDSQVEVQNFVRKTLSYQNTSSSINLRKVWIVGEYLGFGGVADWGGNYKDEIKEGSDAHGYTTVGFENSRYANRFDVSTLYDRDYPGNDWPKSEIIGVINDNVHLINHLGHANVGYVMKMTNTDVDALTNAELYFVGYSQGCYCGSFDDRTTTPGSYTNYDCISEHLTSEAHGAVAFISNSRYGWGVFESTDGPSQHYDREFWDAVLGEDLFNIGMANQDSKEDNAGRVGSWVERYCYYEINLFGDPELRIKLPPAYQHELDVDVEAPDYLEPGDSSVLNATVYNRGLSNETNVELFLLINGTVVNNVTIPQLVNGTSYTIDHFWTPTVEATYNVTAYAPPVSNENVTANNWHTKFVRVTYAVMIGIIETHGESLHSEELANYYRSLGHIVEKITTTITPGVLDNYDIIIVGEDWADTPWLPSEITAVQAYIDSGKGFVGIGDELSTSVQQILGVYGIDYTGIYGMPGSTTNFDPAHPIMLNVYSIYASYPVNSLQVTVPAYYIANDASNTHILIAGSEVGGYILCLSDDFAPYVYTDDNEIMFGNIVEWMTIQYEHELVVTLEAPLFLEPGDSSLLNATVQNRGINNETDVQLQLLINSTIVKNVTIFQLVNGTSYTMNYTWTPTLAGTYNITVYAPPVPGENITSNNVYSKLMPVEYAPRILAFVQYTDYYQEYSNTLRAIESTFGPNYILTEMWDYTQLESMLAGQDILLIPEQEHASLYTMEMIGASWSETLAQFLENGGVIIVCDYSGGTYGILTGAGLMSISGSNSRTGYTFYLVDPSDPLAEGISSSFTAPNGALSFVTSETNVVVDDGIYPAVIHKKIGGGHIALLGFDFYSSNADSQQILGNAVRLAAYITISINPSAGSPGTEVTVSGTKATANGTVSIYWNDILKGNATAKAVGNFTYLLTVPINATLGAHQITAVDTATGRTASTSFRVILIALNPAESPVGTKVTVNGAGFSPESQVTVTFNDMLMGHATIDNFGNFTFTFNIPLSTADTHIVKAFDAQGNYVSTMFTVIDVTPLDVQIDVGAIHFKGEIAEFYAQTTFKGQAVNAIISSVILYKPDGTVENLLAREVTIGLYKISYSITGNAEPGTYTLVITAQYVTSKIQAAGTSFKCFVISSTLTNINMTIQELQGEIATIIIPNLGMIKANLTAINATLVNIKGSLAIVNSTLGLIQADLDTIQLKVIAIEGTTATIQTTLGIMNGTITSIKGDVAMIETDLGQLKVALPSSGGTSGMQYISAAGLSISSFFSGIAATAAIIAVMLLWSSSRPMGLETEKRKPKMRLKKKPGTKPKRQTKIKAKKKMEKRKTKTKAKTRKGSGRRK